MYASGQRDVIAVVEPIGSQKMHDNNQRALFDVANFVFLRGKRAHAVRVLGADGTERWLLGRSVFCVRRRSLRTQITWCTDVGYERVLLQWLVAVRVHLRSHQTVAVDRTHQHGRADRHHRHFAHGQYTTATSFRCP